MLDLRAFRSWPRIGSITLLGPVGPPQGQVCVPGVSGLVGLEFFFLQFVMPDLRAIHSWSRIGSNTLPGPVGPPRGQVSVLAVSGGIRIWRIGQVLTNVLDNQGYAHEIRSFAKQFGTASDHLPSTAWCLVATNGGLEQVLMGSGWLSKQDAW